MTMNHYLVLLFLVATRRWNRVAVAMSSSPSAPQTQQPTNLVTSEGSLVDIKIAPTLASKPGSTPGFYNPKRKIGRDFVVLGVAQWLVDETLRRATAAAAFDSSGEEQSPNESRPVRLLDATCASGIQGLRAAAESPALARAMINQRVKNENAKDKILNQPELKVILNDLDDDAANLAEENVASLQSSHPKEHGSTTVTRRVAQSLMHEETFEISVLDPFGSVQPFLDAAMARSPQRGLIEVCATDVSVLYGTRPKMAKRHYGAELAEKRPPCYRERGVRLLLAAIAQAAGKHDRGIEPVYGISTEHFCLVSVKIARGAKAADATAKQVKRVAICQTTGALLPDDSIAKLEGPLWVGALHDADTIRGMLDIANLEEAEAIVSKETRVLLGKLVDEAAVDGIFHRRPGVAAGGKIPKLTKVLAELERRGFKASRTHFCAKSLKSDASSAEFDDAVLAVLANEK